MIGHEQNSRRRYVRRALVAGLACVAGFASSATAQTATTYTQRVYVQGATAPTITNTFQATAATCNQAPPTSNTTTNPTRWVWDDPAATGRVCIYVEAPGGPLLAAPIGASYEATLAATNSEGSSAESTRAPFSRLGPPPVPGNVRVVK